MLIYEEATYMPFSSDFVLQLGHQADEKGVQTNTRDTFRKEKNTEWRLLLRRYQETCLINELYHKECSLKTNSKYSEQLFFETNKNTNKYKTKTSKNATKRHGTLLSLL